ncbi:hypothetical protein [Fodinicola acaciae]|uniref:hypothetical protein n=1 Tax=Fodinicola acaciae TaxID=2681555 RepID=UPI0013D11835|nr:hypothetical protein [Fodinicola acaciae]
MSEHVGDHWQVQEAKQRFSAVLRAVQEIEVSAPGSPKPTGTRCMFPRLPSATSSAGQPGSIAEATLARRPCSQPGWTISSTRSAAGSCR